MTNDQFEFLSHAEDETFPLMVKHMGFKCAGPGKYGGFLVLDQTGRAWLFGKIMPQGRMKFRTVVPSEWSEENRKAMERER